MDYSRFLNDVTKRRKGTILRDLFNLQIEKGDDWKFLIGGLPHESLFPLISGEFKMADGGKIEINEDLMREALQYGPSAGYPPLVNQLEAMVRKYHDPPLWEDRMVIVTNGSQDALSKIIEMMINPNDFLLMIEPVYAAVMSIVGPYSPKYLTLETDAQGLMPESLRKVLSRWSPDEMTKAEVDVPKFLYINPNGCNPTGSVLPGKRRQEIYKLCSQYNLIILEDDPYYFQQYSPEEEYPPSFLRLDTEGRVIRLDSVSKILGGGLRTGFAVGPKPLIEKVLMHQQVSTQHVSNMPQIVTSLLLKTWGETGFENHKKRMKEFYSSKRDATIDSAKKHLTGLCEWTVPSGGYFFWIKVNDVSDVWEMIMGKAATKKLVMVPGNAFMVDSSEKCQYVRVPFSHSSNENIDEAFKRFAEMIREEKCLLSEQG